MDGWIKLHRKTLENPATSKDSDHLAVWCYLLLKASHQKYRVDWGGQSVTLQPGELITSRLSIASELGLKQSKVYRILNRFKIEQQIEQQANSHGTRITVLQWHKYQATEQPSEQPPNNHRTTTEQRPNTNKNGENGKNGKKGGEYNSPRSRQSLDNRRQEFYDKVANYADQYSPDMLRAFYDYWSQVNENGSKMHFEKQRTFEVKKRLATWYNKSSDQNNGRQNKGKEPKVGEDIRGKTM